MINRRIFVYSGGATAALAAGGGLKILQPRKVFAQSSSDVFFQNQFNIIGTALGNFYNGRALPNDLYAPAQACNDVAAYLQQTGMDASLTSVLNSTDLNAVVNFGGPDPNAMFLSLQTLVPNLTPAYIVGNSPYLSSADQLNSLGLLRKNGLAVLLEELAIDFSYLGQALFPDVHPILRCVCPPAPPPADPPPSNGPNGPFGDGSDRHYSSWAMIEAAKLLLLLH